MPFVIRVPPGCATLSYGCLAFTLTPSPLPGRALRLEQVLGLGADNLKLSAELDELEDSTER